VTMVIMLVLLFAGAFLQMLLPGLAFLGHARVPFLLAIVIYYALTRKTDVMLTAAFLGGLLQDSLSPLPLGYSVFCFVVVGLVIGRFRNLVVSDAPVTQAFFGGSAGALVTLGLYLLLVREGLVACRGGQVVLKVVGNAITGMAATVAAFNTASFLDRLVGNVERNQDIIEVEWSA